MTNYVLCIMHYLKKPYVDFNKNFFGFNVLLRFYLLKLLLYEFANCKPKQKHTCVLVSLKLFIIRTTKVPLFKRLQQ